MGQDSAFIFIYFRLHVMREKISRTTLEALMRLKNKCNKNKKMEEVEYPS